MNKKGQLGLIVKLILAGLIITLVASTILNKNFYYDALDFIENMFEPPEIDPMPSHTRMMVERENTISQLQLWVETFNSMQISNEPYCYARLPETTRASRDEELAIIFNTNTQDTFDLRVSQKGASVTRHVTINTPLCLIAELRGSEFGNARNTLSNFDDAFVKYNQQNINNCLNNPSLCALIVPEIKSLSNKYAVHEEFSAEFRLNAEDIANRRTSFSFNYFVTNIQGEIEEIISSSSGKLSDAGFLLFKIQDNICIMPLAQQSVFRLTSGGTRKTDELNILRRSTFFNRDFTLKEELKRIPECTPQTLLPDSEVNDALEKFLFETNTNLEFKITIKETETNSDDKNEAIFTWIQTTQEWHVKIKEQGKPVKDENILDEDADTTMMPMKTQLKNIIIRLREENKVQGIKYLINYNNEGLDSIKINDEELNYIKQQIKTQGPEIISEIIN